MTSSSLVFRVFVSSTFADLSDERAALQAKVFPDLERLCAGHGAQFQAIDLRWGVSEEASLDQQAVTICLEEIARCQRITARPNFILLLGDRYGWRPLPPAIPGDELEQILDRVPVVTRRRIRHWYRHDLNAVPHRYLLQPRDGEFERDEAWGPEERTLRAALSAGAEAAGLDDAACMKFVASVTEQEAALGIFGQPDVVGHAFCFLRTIQGLPAGAAGFRDLDNTGERDSEAAERLERLKRRLRDRLGPEAVFEYSAAWAGSGPTLDHLPQLCEDVYAALARSIEAELAGAEALDPLERELEQHLRFGRDRRQAFVGRRTALERIAGYLSGDGEGPLAVTGPSGAGKTALMAEAMVQARRDFPDTRVLQRFIGATPRSASVRTLLQDLCRQLARLRGDDEASLPVGYHDLAERFRQELDAGQPGGGLVLFLDALDQLEHDRLSPDLSWLPARLPPAVRVVVSAVDGPVASSAARKFRSEPLQLESMSPTEGSELLDHWLADVHRTLQPHQRREVLDKFGPEGLPLYLKLAFEEARRWASYLSAERTVLSSTIPGIIRDLLSRLSAVENHGAVIVRRSLGYLATSRNGLSEGELLDVLSNDNEVLRDFKARSPRSPDIGKRLPMVAWSRLSFDLEPYLSDRRADGEMLRVFYHRQLADEVEKRYLGGGEGRERHQALARYFADRGFGPAAGDADQVNIRSLSELPYQQTLGELWDDVFATLTNFRFLEAKMRYSDVEERLGADGTVSRTYMGAFLLQDDFGFAVRRWPSHGLATMPARADQRVVLAAFGRALAREASALARRPELTWQQLANRLQWAGADVAAVIQSELDRRTSADGPPWLRLKTGFPESEALIRTLPADSQWAFGCSVDAAGSVAASVGADGVVKVWDARAGELRLELREHEGIATGCAVSPDGSLVCSTGADGAVRIWNVEDGTLRATLLGHRASANACALGPDSQLLVSVGSDGTLRFWNVMKAMPLAVLAAHDDVAGACAVSPDGSLVVSAGRDGTVRVWDAASADRRGMLTLKSPVLACAAGPAAMVVAGCEDGTLSVWNAAQATEQMRIHAHDGGTKGCTISSDGSLIATAGGDATVKLWDTARGSLLTTLRGHAMDVEACAISRDGSILISAGGDGTLRVWDPSAAATAQVTAGHQALVWSCEFTQQGDMAVSGGEDGALLLWDGRSGHTRGAYDSGQAAAIKDCVITPDDRLVITVRDDGTVRLFDLATSREAAVLRGHSGAVNACSAFPDAKLIVSAGSDRTCRIWDVNAQGEVGLMLGHTDQVWHCAVSPDGSFFVSASHDETLRLWRPEPWRSHHRLAGHQGQVWHCSVSPDAALVASAGSDRTARLWVAQSGELLVILKGHEGAVTRCAFTPDGNRVITASIDHTIGIWDVRSGQRIITLDGHVGPVWAFGLSPSGRFLVTGGHDGAVIVWDLASGSRLAQIPFPARLWCIATHPCVPVFACGGDGGLFHLLDLAGGSGLVTSSTWCTPSHI